MALKCPPGISVHPHTGACNLLKRYKILAKQVQVVVICQKHWDITKCNTKMIMLKIKQQLSMMAWLYSTMIRIITVHKSLCKGLIKQCEQIIH